MNYQILDWDSDFFGIKVARIAEPSLTVEKLTSLLSELEQNKVELVYWFSDQELNDDETKGLRGHLVDVKTTFAVDLRCLNIEDFVSTDIVEVYTQSMPIADMEKLAIQSGEYSRFAVDPNFPKGKFVALYKTWMNRSVNRVIASEVLVIRDVDRIAGMVTLGEKNGRGDIGLIAVGRNFRGKKYGTKLVRAAQQWFVKNGFAFGQVVTQGMNIRACNLYKKCDYSIEKVAYVYHFWL